MNILVQINDKCWDDDDDEEEEEEEEVNDDGQQTNQFSNFASRISVLELNEFYCNCNISGIKHRFRSSNTYIKLWGLRA